MQIPHNLKLRLSDCGRAIETSGLASVIVAQMNPCGSLDADENAMLGELLASAPDLLRQRNAMRKALGDAADMLERLPKNPNEFAAIAASARNRCEGTYGDNVYALLGGLLPKIALDNARAILAETEDSHA